jgi:hypothetical protein
MESARRNEGQPHAEVVGLAQVISTLAQPLEHVSYLQELRSSERKDANTNQLGECDARKNLATSQRYVQAMT